MDKRIGLLFITLMLLGACRPADQSYPLVETPVPDSEYYQSGLASVEQRVKSNPGNPDAHYKKAMYLEALGQTDAALASIKQAIALDPTPEYLVMEANLLMVKGDNEQALNRVSRAQILGGDYPEVWRLLAELNYRTGNYRTALSNINKALQKHPQGTAYYLTKGQIQWSLHDTLGAVQSLEKSAEHPETRYRSLKELVAISKVRGDYQSGFAYLNQNRSTHKGDRSLLLDLGQLLRESAQYDTALAVFHYLRARDSLDHRLYYESALIHFNQHRYDSSMYYCEKTLELRPDHLGAMLTQARIYDRRNYYTTALNSYNRILEIDSTYLPAVEDLEKLKGKIAYLQKIRQNRERNAGLRILTPSKPSTDNN